MNIKEIVRILANVRFKPRSDKLENWERENPVLLSGEPGVVINGTETDKVKFGDGVTPWNDLPYWRGPKGEQGPEGKKGESGKPGQDGNDGVDGKDGLTPYINESGNWQIGNTDTGIKATGDNGTDGVGISDVSINSDGELIVTLTSGDDINLGRIQGEPGKDAITDQTYNPESENAQSGKAVAEAISSNIQLFQVGKQYKAGDVVIGEKYVGEVSIHGFFKCKENHIATFNSFAEDEIDYYWEQISLINGYSAYEAQCNLMGESLESFVDASYVIGKIDEAIGKALEEDY